MVPSLLPPNGLRHGKREFVPIWAPDSAEDELKDAFEKTPRVREAGRQPQDLLMRGSSRPQCVCTEPARAPRSFTGLKPAGFDWGPVVPEAEQATKTIDPTDAVGFVLRTID